MQKLASTIRVIGFDADDTLWANEPHYQQLEHFIGQRLAAYVSETTWRNELYATETQNLALYGYGAKSFILSMIETALRVSDHKLDAEQLATIVHAGKSLLQQPVELLPHVREVLQQLSPRYRLILATKGDLLDQQRKLQASGLASLFAHVEIMSEKDENSYQSLLARLGIAPAEFLMVGNSVSSDVLPVVAIGAQAVHIPFAITWQHEARHTAPSTAAYVQIQQLPELLTLLDHA